MVKKSKQKQVALKKQATKKTSTQKLEDQKNMARRKLHDESVKNAKVENLKLGVIGKVRCGKLQSRFAPAHVDKKWPAKEGYKNINCCSGAQGIFKFLSPMKLVPSVYEYDGEETIQATNIENLWQFSKVWPGEEDPDTGLPNKEWFERRKNGWLDVKAHRHVKKGPKDATNRNIPMYSYWKGEKLSYLEARKKIYCPIYAQEVVKSEAYKKLHKMVHEEGYNVSILGFDGIDYHAEGKTLKELFDDPSRPFGHELLLCGLLTGDHVWV
jgi:hypothetical protein